MPPGTQRTFQIVVQFKSDGGVSDSDGPLNAFYGAVGMDDISLTDNLIGGPTGPYTFDDGTLQGWTAGTCPAVGSFMGVADRGVYTLTDPCACALLGNVLEMHNGSNVHPDGQNEECRSPIIDRSGVPASYNLIQAEWDQYADMPQANGVFYRVGWTYYPYYCNGSPTASWSPRVGIATFYYVGDVPACFSNVSVGTVNGLPSGCTQCKLIYEINASCESFGITNCSGVTNFSPIIDNIKVCNVGVTNAPVATFDTGTRFQDGFGQTNALGLLSTTDAGNSDDVYNLRMGVSTAAPRLGDSLVVKGPLPTNSANRWNAKLWFRLRRVGPGQTTIARYNTWKAAQANVDYPTFAWGYMDTVEIAAGPQKEQYCSYFREGSQGANWGGAGERNKGNEMLPDSVFTPGTKIEYFVTTNYINNPIELVYPDTTGNVFQEFEILPSYRTIGGVDKFPCVLYVDAFNGGAQYYIEKSLNVALNGLTVADPVPDPTGWDRYDYMDASSNWNASMYRNSGGNNGMTIPQMLGYKLIMVSLGDAATGSMEPRDWQGFDQWLSSGVCDGNTNLQGLIVDGMQSAEIIKTDSPHTLAVTLGASMACPIYNAVGCLAPETVSNNDTNNCIRLEQLASPFAAGIPTDIFGNWCPEKQSINVLGALTPAVGNKKFVKIASPTYPTSFAQVINDKLGAVGLNYRSIIEAFSYHRLIQPATAGVTECEYVYPADETPRVTAAYVELQNAIRWTMNIPTGTAVSNWAHYCVDPCGSNPTGVGDEAEAGVAVTRLYQNRPNPFNPRTAIKFSLAADGPTKLIIYDVNGRRVKTLVDQSLKAGTHEEVWDGTDDAGRTVTSGVYWSQLQTGAYSSNKKMVVLK